MTPTAVSKRVVTDRLDLIDSLKITFLRSNPVFRIRCFNLPFPSALPVLSGRFFSPRLTLPPLLIELFKDVPLPPVHKKLD